VKTALSEDQAREVLRQYSLRLRGLWPLSRGTVNSNYFVETDAGPLFLRINEGKSAVDAAFEAALLWHLGSRGVRTPALWRTRSGAAYVPLPRLSSAQVKAGAGQPVMLMSWIDGVEYTDEELGVAEAWHVGELLAQLHLGAQDFAEKRPGIYTLRHIAERLERVRADKRAQAELGELPDELSAEAARLVVVRRSDLPSGLGHNDLFPDNLLFPRRLLRRRSGAQTQGGWILDLEQAATLPYAYDLAVALLAFCAPVPAEITEASGPPNSSRLGPLRTLQARALLAGYQALRALGEPEWQGLCEELRYAALRFTVTRLTDVHGYGAAHPPAAAEPAAEPASRPKARLKRKQPVHSKDYRDFLWRWRELKALDAETLVSGLK